MSNKLKTCLVLAVFSLALCVPPNLLAGNAPPDDPFDPMEYDYWECGTEVNPGFYEAEIQGLQAQPPEMMQFPERHSPYYLGVAFHIVRNDNGFGGVPEETIDYVLNSMNGFYEEGGYIFFQIADVEYIDHTVFNSNMDSLYVMRTEHDVPNAVNIYYTSALPIGMGGYSGSVGSGSTYTMLNSTYYLQVSIASHEVGHVLYLYHTHQGGNECPDGSNCETAGDLICDTPADPDMYDYMGPDCTYNGEATPPAECGSTPYNPDVSNIMSYAPSSCYDHFTSQQFQRMEGYLYNHLSRIIYDIPHAVYVNAANGSNSNYGTANYPYASIAYALTQVHDGDTILVGPGTYYGQVIVDKDIAIISTEGPSLTNLTPSWPFDNVVTFSNVDGDIAALDGFKISGGSIGVFCENSNPTISHCVLDSQTTSIHASILLGGSTPGGLGSSGARLINNTIMNCANSGIDNFSSEAPLILNNIVTGNAHGLRQGFGAAEPDDDYNDIWDNPHSPYYPYLDSNYVGDSITIGAHSISEDPILSENYRLYYGSPCVDAGDPDPAYNDPDTSRNDIGAIPLWIDIVPLDTLYVDDDGCPGCYTTIADAIADAENYYEIHVYPGTYTESINFWGKTIRLVSLEGPEQTHIIAGNWGWALNMESGERPWTEISGFTFTSTLEYPINLMQLGSSCSVKIDNCIFKDYSPEFYVNMINIGSHHRGTIEFERNLFYNNHGTRCFLINSDADSVLFINNTFDDNIVGIVSVNSLTVCKNNIITNHSLDGIFGSYAELDYNDVWNNTTNYAGGAVAGAHDISADPRYDDPAERDYHLTVSSPCINAGDPDPQYNDPNGTRNDMGVFPFERLIEPILFPKTGGEVPQLFTLNPNHPNPFNPETEISFVLPQPAHVKLEVYNILGRKVKTLIDEPLDAGRQSVVWDGTSNSGSCVSSGIYFYRLTAGDFVASRKMSLIK